MLTQRETFQALAELRVRMIAVHALWALARSNRPIPARVYRLAAGDAPRRELLAILKATAAAPIRPPPFLEHSPAMKEHATDAELFAAIDALRVLVDTAETKQIRDAAISARGIAYARWSRRVTK